VVFRQEFSTPVSNFLSGIDVFLFFLSWKREEPWARSAGEALMSGCPVITTARGGNKNQVVHGNTGFLCKTVEDFANACTRLVENPPLLETMRLNAKRAARHFTSDAVVQRFLDFIQ
jgi:trehalose synthase